MQKTADGVGYISTSDGNRETLGTQLMRHAVKPFYKQEAGESIAEAGKQVLRELESGISKARAKGVHGVIYGIIYETEVGRNFGVPVIKYTVVITNERPKPRWHTVLYRHNEHDTNPIFEYALPEPVHIPGILKHAKSYTARYIRTILSMLKGRLK